VESLSSLKHYADVVTVLAQKDFKIRYRNSALGFLWSLINPLAYMTILTFVFAFLFHVSNLQYYAGWLLIGLLIYRFFSVGTSQGLTCIVANPSLVGKVYLPRYLIVLSNNLANFIGATLEFVALFPLLLFFGVNLSYHILLLPIVLLIEFWLVFSLSLALSSLNLKYRDFYQLWDIALQLGFYLSPVVYDSSLIPARYKLVYSLNPVTVLIDSTREILLHNQAPTFLQGLGLLASIGTMFVIGFMIFRRIERSFAEEL